jgi:hypothetical protein
MALFAVTVETIVDVPREQAFLAIAPIEWLSFPLCGSL